MLERILDIAADLTGIDPAEIRRKNFIQPAQFPYTTITGANYDSGEYEKALDAARAQIDRQGGKGAGRRRVEDGRAYGPGVADMKSGLVLNVFVAEALARLSPVAPLRWLAGVTHL